MRYVEKFIICVFLSLVIFTPKCFAARNCNDQVKFSATFKWLEGRVSIITSDIDRQIADDTEVYNAAKARIDVLAGMFTKPLQQGRRFEGCNVSATCDAGKSVQECSSALARCFAEIVAKDEYIANLQNRLCNSGINLNPQNDSFRDFITSYTPLRLSAPAGGGTLLTGSVDEAPVVQSTDQEIDVKQTISNQTNAMSVGVSFVYAGAQMKSINALMNQWNRACETLSRKPDRADTTGFRNTSEGGKIRHTCIIKTCRGRGYAPSADGLSCVLAESGGTTTPASSSGGGSTPAPASTPPARSNTSRDDLADDNQMINDQINKSAGRGNMSRDGGGVSGRGIGAIITEINTSANNMKINAGFSYPESMVSTGGMQLQTAIANWIARCMEYPQGHESAAIKEMNHKKTTENGTVRHLCEIKSCLSEYMTPTEEGCKRDRTEIATLPSRSAPLIPTGETGPDKLVYIGGSLTFTDKELNDSAFSDSVNNWERKCNSYPEDSNDLAINATYVKKDNHRKQNTWTCLIQTCNEDEAGLPRTPSPDGKSCISQDGSSCTAGDRHADRTRYDARQGVCVIETCKEDYTLVDGKCEKTRKLERQQARATTKLEKDFVSDITKLSEAFESVVKRLTKECEKSGGTINNGVCENAQTTGQQSKAPNNRRGSGRR